MEAEIREYIAGIVGKSEFTALPISGGDIAETFLVDDGVQRFMLKVQEGLYALEMLNAEYLGLEEIRKTKTINVPRVFHYGSSGHHALLLMEYVESRQPVARDFERLGLGLARLHQVRADEFGLDQDNYIGSLPQKNAPSREWSAFYVRNRLIPQFDLALASGLLSPADTPGEGVLTERVVQFFHNIRPSLIHGDLWSGNYLISAEGTPYLIDPAIYYGHSEVDLAMSRLFGGFGSSFYQAYTDIHPISPGSEARNDIYQLYYLLVHLNLFGASYRSSVVHTLRKYFQ